MQLELYLAETAAHAARQQQILLEARTRLDQQGTLSPLEFSGVLHALQVLIENAIGKAKICLKQAGQPVPVSAYDSFALLQQLGHLTAEQLQDWQRAIGLRNRIVHDYLNLDPQLITQLLQSNAYTFIVQFLTEPFGPAKDVADRQ